MAARRRVSRDTDTQALRKLGQSIDRIARHAEKLAAALRLVVRSHRAARRSRRAATKKKKK